MFLTTHFPWRLTSKICVNQLVSKSGTLIWFAKCLMMIILLLHLCKPWSHHVLITEKLFAQNAAARMLTRTRKCDHISPVLQRLHWLHVRYQIHFKLLFLTWKALHNMALPCISELINLHIPFRHLRSSNKRYLHVLRTLSSWRSAFLLSCT